MMTSQRKLEIFPPHVVSMDMVKFENVKPKYSISENISFDYVVNGDTRHSSRNWVGLFPRGSTNLQQFVVFEWTIVCPKDESLNRQSMTFHSRHFAPYVEFNKEYQLLFVTKNMQVLGGSSFFRFLPDEESSITQSEDDHGSVEKHEILQRLETFLASQSQPGSSNQYPYENESSKDFSHGDCNGISGTYPDQDPPDNSEMRVEVRSFDLPSPMQAKCTHISGRKSNDFQHVGYYSENIKQKSTVCSSVSESICHEGEADHEQLHYSISGPSDFKEGSRSLSPNLHISEHKSPQQKQQSIRHQRKGNVEKQRPRALVSRQSEHKHKSRNKVADINIQESHFTGEELQVDSSPPKMDQRSRLNTSVGHQCEDEIIFRNESGEFFVHESNFAELSQQVEFSPHKINSSRNQMDESSVPISRRHYEHEHKFRDKFAGVNIPESHFTEEELQTDSSKTDQRSMLSTSVAHQYEKPGDFYVHQSNFAEVKQRVEFSPTKINMSRDQRDESNTPVSRRHYEHEHRFREKSAVIYIQESNFSEEEQPRKVNISRDHRNMSSIPVPRHNHKHDQKLRNKSSGFYIHESNFAESKQQSESSTRKVNISTDFDNKLSAQHTEDIQKQARSPDVTGMTINSPSYTPPSFLNNISYNPPICRSKILSIDTPFTPFDDQGIQDTSNTTRTTSPPRTGREDGGRCSPRSHHIPDLNSPAKETQTQKNGFVKTTSPDPFSPVNKSNLSSPFCYQKQQSISTEDTFILPDLHSSVSFNRLNGAPHSSNLPTFASPDLPLNSNNNPSGCKRKCTNCKQPLEFAVILEQYLSQIKSASELNQDLRKRIAELERDVEKSEVAQQKLKLAAEYAKREKVAYQKFVGEMLSTISKKGFARIINAEGTELLVKRVTQIGATKDEREQPPAKRKLTLRTTGSHESSSCASQSKATLDPPEGEQKENWLNMMSELTEVYHRKWKKSDKDTVICDPPSSSNSVEKEWDEITLNATSTTKVKSNETLSSKLRENAEEKNLEKCPPKEDHCSVYETEKVISITCIETRDTIIEKSGSKHENTEVEHSLTESGIKLVDAEQIQTTLCIEEVEIKNKEMMNRCLAQLSDIHLNVKENEDVNIDDTLHTASKETICTGIEEGNVTKLVVLEDKECPESEQRMEHDEALVLVSGKRTQDQSQQTELIVEEFSDVSSDTNKLSWIEGSLEEVSNPDTQHKQQQTELCIEIKHKKSNEDSNSDA